jgi:G protein beta subunit-like protein
MPAVILASAGYDHMIRFWEAHSGANYRTIQHPDSQVNRLEITPDKAYIAAAGNPHVKLFDANANNGTPLTSYDGHTTNVTAVGFHKDGKWLFTGSEDSTIKIWDLRAPGCQREFTSPAPINSVVLHPNQGELISGDQAGNVRVWDLTANACSRELVPDGENAVRSVSVASDGSLLAAANNKGNCFLWKLGEDDTSRCDPFQKLEAHRHYILKCLFSPDTKQLATCSADKTVRIWRQEVRSAGTAPSASPRPPPLDPSTPQEFRAEKTLSGHQRWVWDCVFSADSAYLVTASSDQSAKLWDLNLGESIRHYTGHQKAVTCVVLAD